MLTNYRRLPDGVIEQILKNPISYNSEYISERYESFKEKSLRMSHLRLGFLCGTIGEMPSSILDVGYGNGDFLSVCVEAGIKSYGIEVNVVS